jgi:DNA primase
MDDDMHGSIVKLIKMYGNETLLAEYKDVIRSIRDSELYRLHFSNNDFNIDTSIIQKDELKFPESYQLFKKDKPFNKTAMKYLNGRGISWDIIERYKLGFTGFQDENKKSSYRIIIPSYNAFGELNYWVGRNYLPVDRVKYDNPKTEKKDIIFNEEKLVWDADITLVEGPFDHIVVPNSVPLLGKALNNGYKLYWELISRANANVNIFLDADAKDTALEIYRLLNHGRLYGKIRYIPVEDDEDPSSLYQKGGYKEIARHLANAQQIDEVYLQ